MLDGTLVGFDTAKRVVGNACGDREKLQSNICMYSEKVVPFFARLDVGARHIRL